MWGASIHGAYSIIFILPDLHASPAHALYSDDVSLYLHAAYNYWLPGVRQRHLHRTHSTRLSRRTPFPPLALALATPAMPGHRNMQNERNAAPEPFPLVFGFSPECIPSAHRDRSQLSDMPAR